jgi:hypothetical protein
MMQRLFVLCCVLLATPWVLAPPVRADDDITVRAAVAPTTAAVGDQVSLTIEVRGKFRRSMSPQLPPLDDFDIFEAGTAQNFSFVNGQATSSITFSYVLVPKAEGSFRIEPIQFTVNGKQYTANPITLEVTAAGAGVGAPPTGNAPDTESRGDLSDESIFVAASVDADTVYVNQQITWTLGYYTDGRVDLLRSPNYSPPGRAAR